MLATGMTVPAVADELGLNKTTVYRWMENNRDFRRAATMARLDAIGEYTAEIRETLARGGIEIARLYVHDTIENWDTLTQKDKQSAVDWLGKNFKTPEDRTSYKETRELKVETKWPDTGLPPVTDAIEAEVIPVDDAPAD